MPLKSLFSLALLALHYSTFTFAAPHEAGALEVRADAYCGAGIYGELLPYISPYAIARVWCSQNFPVPCTAAPKRKRAVVTTSSTTSAVVKTTPTTTTKMTTTKTTTTAVNAQISAWSKALNQAVNTIKSLCYCMETTKACSTTTTKSTTTWSTTKSTTVITTTSTPVTTTTSKTTTSPTISTTASLTTTTKSTSTSASSTTSSSASTTTSSASTTTLCASSRVTCYVNPTTSNQPTALYIYNLCTTTIPSSCTLLYPATSTTTSSAVPSTSSTTATTLSTTTSESSSTSSVTTTPLIATTSSSTCQAAGASCFLNSVTVGTLVTVLDNCCVQGACATAASPTCNGNTSPTTLIITLLPTTSTSTTVSSTSSATTSTMSTTTTTSTTSTIPPTCKPTAGDGAFITCNPAYGCHRNDYPVGGNGCIGCLKRSPFCDDGQTYCVAGYGVSCNSDADCRPAQACYARADGSNVCGSNSGPYTCSANPPPSTTSTTSATTSSTTSGNVVTSSTSFSTESSTSSSSTTASDTTTTTSPTTTASTTTTTESTTTTTASTTTGVPTCAPSSVTGTYDGSVFTVQCDYNFGGQAGNVLYDYPGTTSMNQCIQLCDAYTYNSGTSSVCLAVDYYRETLHCYLLSNTNDANGPANWGVDAASRPNPALRNLPACATATGFNQYASTMYYTSGLYGYNYNVASVEACMTLCDQTTDANGKITCIAADFNSQFGTCYTFSSVSSSGSSGSTATAIVRPGCG